MMSQLVEVLDEIERLPSRALLVQDYPGADGDENTFCSGADLVAVSEAGELGFEIARVMQHSLMRIQNFDCSGCLYRGTCVGRWR